MTMSPAHSWNAFRRRLIWLCKPATNPNSLRRQIVLPVTIWSEQEGHYINLDGRVQKTQKVLTSPEQVRDNLAVLNELATRMNISLESNWKQAILARKSSVALNYRPLN
jgi:NADH dehydrogenase/NADH:ubiquinone oxidoreductase subunit G